MTESPAADVGHAARDDDGSQADAIRESLSADAGHAVGLIIVSDGGGDDHFARVIAAGSHGCVVAREVVADAVYLGIVGEG